MILTLLSHQWKAFWRSRNAGQSIVLQLFVGFVILYLLASFFFLGVSLKRFLPHLFPGLPVIESFCGLILYYFFIDILLRFFFQDLPSFAIQPYLLQNIRRTQLATFINLRSLPHFLNVLPLLLFLPFTLMYIPAGYGPLATAALAMAIVFGVFFNHFAMQYIMRKSFFNSWWALATFGLLVGLSLLPRFHVMTIQRLSAGFFLRILQTPALVTIPFALAVLAFFNNQLFLQRNLYLEELTKGSGKRRSTDYTFLRRWGMPGELAALDVKLILRNKRSRPTLYLSFIVLAYGFIYYQPMYMRPMNYGMLVIAAFLVSGAFIVNFGRFAFAWQSVHFDGIMCSNLEFADLVRAKLLLYNIVSTSSLLICSFYGLIDWRILPMQLAAWLYNVGCTSVISLWIATYNYKPIDLSKTAAFNYQGNGGTANLLFTLIIFILPMLIYAPFSIFIGPWAGVTAIGAIGLISLLLRNVWITILTKEFYKRKPLILEGFREK